MKLFYGLFFWWVVAGTAYLLGLPPGLFETILTLVIGFAAASVSTVCLRICIEQLFRPKPFLPHQALALDPERDAVEDRTPGSGRAELLLPQGFPKRRP